MTCASGFLPSDGADICRSRLYINMHFALSVLELLFNIFSDPILVSQPISEGDDNPTEQDSEDYLRRHPLLSLALTCKTFSPIALRVLWRDIEGIDQLLWTMSDDIIEIALFEESEDSGSQSSSSSDSSKSKEHRECMIFTKQPVEQDWEPFDRYGALVRRLKSRCRGASGDLLELAPNVLEALNARYDIKGTPLLPNLQSLTCRGRQLRYAHTLLGPRLYSLTIPATWSYGLSYDLSYDPSYDLHAFLQLAKLNTQTRLNILESFKLGEQAPDKEVGALFSEFVINMQQNGEGLQILRIASFAWFSLEAMNLVLANERIQALQIGVEQFDLDRVLPLGTSIVRENLRALMVTTAKGVTSNSLSSQSLFPEFLRRLNARNLMSFTFSGASRYSSVHDIRALFTFLHCGNAPAKDDLDWGSSPDICIFPPKSAEPPDDIMIDPAHHICTFANSFYLACQPISSTDPTPRFGYIKILQLNVLVDFTDSDIGTLSSSMPRLACFEVETNRAGRTGPSRTTLIGIWFLAKNCRDLDSLKIWFNAVLDWEQFASITKVGMASVSDEEGRRTALQNGQNSNLSSLLVGDSDIGDVDVVTKFLYYVFPYLQGIGRIGENREGWEAVQAIFTDGSSSSSASYLTDYMIGID